MIRKFSTALIAVCCSSFLLAACSEAPQSTILATGTPVVSETSTPSDSSSSPAPANTTGLPDTSIITYTYLVSGDTSPNNSEVVKLSVNKETSTLVRVEKGKVVFEETRATAPKVWTGLATAFPNIRTLTSGDSCGSQPGKAVEVSGDMGTLFAVGYQKCSGAWSQESNSLDAWLQPALEQFPS